MGRTALRYRVEIQIETGRYFSEHASGYSASRAVMALRILFPLINVDAAGTAPEPVMASEHALFDWTQQEPADAAHIGVATIRLFESETAETRHATIAVVKWAFESAGVEFIDENGGGPGVRLRKRTLGK